MHVLATVDPTQNTVDYHINLLSVKGRGTVVAAYIGYGSSNLLNHGFPGSNITAPVAIDANLGPLSGRAPGFWCVVDRRDSQFRGKFHSEYGVSLCRSNLEAGFLST